jgi:hypothetical protein
LTIVLPAFLQFMFGCSLSVSLGRMKIRIFWLCAVWLSWNLVKTSHWYPRLACKFCFHNLTVFLCCKQTKEEKNPKSRILQFYKTCIFSTVPSLIDLKLGGDIWTSNRNSVVWLYVYIIVCLHFINININKENTLYEPFGHLRVKSFEIWWMSLPNRNKQSWVFCCWIDHLFMFHGCKQAVQFGAISKNAKRSTIWVSNERSSPTE